MGDATRTIHCNKCKKNFQLEMRALAGLGHCPECRAPRYEMSLVGALTSSTSDPFESKPKVASPFAQTAPMAQATPEPAAQKKPFGGALVVLFVLLLIGGGIAVTWWLFRSDGRDEFRTSVAQGLATDVLHTGLYNNFSHPDAYREAFELPELKTMNAEERGAWFDAFVEEDRVVYFYEACDIRGAINDELTSASIRDFWNTLDVSQQAELLALAVRSDRGRRIVRAADKYAGQLDDLPDGLTPAALETLLEMDLATIEATREGIDRLLEIGEPEGDTLILDYRASRDLSDEIYAEMKSRRAQAFERNKERCSAEAAASQNARQALAWLESTADNMDGSFMSTQNQFEAKRGEDGWKVTRQRRFNREEDSWGDWETLPNYPGRLLGLSYSGKLADGGAPTFDGLKEQLLAALKEHRQDFIDTPVNE